MDRAIGYHTYDHRVDEFFEALGEISKAPQVPAAASSPFGAAVARLAEIDSVGCGEAVSHSWLGSSYVVRLHRDIAGSGQHVDAMILTSDDAISPDLLDRTHRYVICSPALVPTVRAMLNDVDRSFKESQDGDVAIFDFEVPGYIVRNEA
jgi:nitrogen regulatory protein PII